MITSNAPTPITAKSLDCLHIAAWVAAKFALQAFFLTRYGIHRDELYFLEGARRIDFGYVDHAPFTVWVAALMEAIGSGNLFLLRLPSAMAGALAMLLTLLIVRRMGGGRLGFALAALGMLLAPAYLRMHGMLHLPGFELVFWTLNSYLLVRLLSGGSAWLWLAIGAVAGLGLLNKHTMLVWGAALMVAMLLAGAWRRFDRAQERRLAPDSKHNAPDEWRLLLDWRAYLGAAAALLLFLPNLAWQFVHDWPTLEFARAMSQSFDRNIPAGLFLAGQVLYIGFAALPLWIAGLWALFFGELGRLRALGLLYLAAAAVFLVTGGKPYYLAAAYPALIAAGAVFWERRLLTRSARARVSGTEAVAARRPAWAAALFALAMLAGGLLTLPAALPILPVEKTDAYTRAVLFGAIDPHELTHDFHDMFGWREQAASVARVVQEVSGVKVGAPPPGSRRKPRQGSGGETTPRVAVLTANYGQAAAFRYYESERLGVGVHSGHMSWYLWGPPAEEVDTFVVIGYDLSFLEERFASVTVAAVADHRAAAKWERKQTIYVCREARRHPHADWGSYKRYGFRS